MCCGVIRLRPATAQKINSLQNKSQSVRDFIESNKELIGNVHRNVNKTIRQNNVIVSDVIKHWIKEVGLSQLNKDMRLSKTYYRIKTVKPIVNETTKESLDHVNEVIKE